MLTCNLSLVRVRRAPPQACRRGQGQADRAEEETGLIHEEVEEGWVDVQLCFMIMDCRSRFSNQKGRPRTTAYMLA